GGLHHGTWTRNPGVWQPEVLQFAPVTWSTGPIIWSTSGHSDTNAFAGYWTKPSAVKKLPLGRVIAVAMVPAESWREIVAPPTGLLPAASYSVPPNVYGAAVPPW